MTIDVILPALSPTMTDAKLAKWHKRIGEHVTAGDIIAEIETDKATMEIEAAEDGVLSEILVPAGTEGVAVGRVIARFAVAGESQSLAEGGTQKTNDALPTPQVAATTDPSPSSARDKQLTEVPATALAIRIAAQAGLDLARVTGSGAQGRIMAEDVTRALGLADRGASATAPEPAPLTRAVPAVAQTALSQTAAHSVPDRTGQADVPVSSMRRAIARRMLQSRQSVPHFSLTVDCGVDAVMKLREDMNARAGSTYRLSLNDFVIRGAALALERVPEANASWNETVIRHWQHADVAFAVALDAGLITPIIRAAEGKTIGNIARETKRLVERAKSAALSPEEYEGGTITISNLGMFDIRQFEAIINPPHACILAIGAAAPRAVVKDGGIVACTLMTCTLTADHRVLDGATGARFLGTFKSLIEDPMLLLL